MNVQDKLVFLRSSLNPDQGRQALVLQFHVEADISRMKEWLTGHTCALIVLIDPFPTINFACILICPMRDKRDIESYVSIPGYFRILQLCLSLPTSSLGKGLENCYAFFPQRHE